MKRKLPVLGLAVVSVCGLEEPHQPVPDDIPLLLPRLAIIEEVAPYGDDFMIEQLAEAYKDLVNMSFHASR